MLPNFIGIGVQKGGTSWLHKQLTKHPDVFIPKDRKEIHFFDDYFDRGVEWYEKFFPEDASSFKAVGEITPRYIYEENVTKNIAATLPENTKFIVSLREPVSRAFSHYQMTFQSGEGQRYKDFDDFMESHPHGFKRGLYADQIARYFEFFKPGQFLFLVYEETFKDEAGPAKTLKNVQKFLGISPFQMDENISERVGGARSVPKYPAISKFAQKMRLKLRDWNMDWVATSLKKAGITRQILGGGGKIPAPEERILQKWKEAYAPENKNLEELLKRNFPDW